MQSDLKVDDGQMNNDNSDVLYTHVENEFVEPFADDTKDESKQKSTKPVDSNQSDDKSNTRNATTQPTVRTLTKAEREKLYRLPQTPHIIVHPSKTAKNGKFECQLVSLGHILNYRKDDNKESSFEVCLFAEYFNEMLVRDHGFVIYKNILSIRTDKDKELTALALSASNLKRKLSGEVKLEDDTSADSKRPKMGTDTETGKKVSDVTEVKKEEEKPKTIQLTKPKPKTIYPEVLLAFNYIDVAKSGIISEKDLEDLLLCIGLALSRSKIKALFMKLNIKDASLNYRSLTDKSQKEVDAMGNESVKFRLPSDDEIVANIISADSQSKRVEPNMVKQDASVVEINGSMIDVVNTIKNLEKSEQNALKLDQKLKEASEEIGKFIKSIILCIRGNICALVSLKSVKYVMNCIQ